MGKKIFLDTNIMLDFLDDKRKYHNHAQRLIAYLSKEGWQIVISEDMLSTIFYIHKNNRQVLEFFEYILKHWSVVPYGLQLMQDAVGRSLQMQADLEDMLQCLCARKEGCSIVVTEDKSFVNCGIDVVDYERFLSET